MNCKDRFPRPSRCAPPPDAPMDACAPAFLLQKILAAGQMHRRCAQYPVNLCSLPEDAQPPFTVNGVFLCGQPSWREEECFERRGIRLRVTLPVGIRVQDACCKSYVISQQIEEGLALHPVRSASDCWRGQIWLQAAVRLACPPRSIREPCGDIPLEVLINGYLLCACQSRPVSPCGDRRPLYPPSICSPGMD